MAINIVGNDTAETFAVSGSQLNGGVIDGGAGIDVLDLWDYYYPKTFDFTTLTTFRNIEVIRGVLEIAEIRIRADQLADVTTIDSGETNYFDQVTIVGTSIDLRGKTFVGNLTILPENADAVIMVSDFAVASLIKPAVRGTHVHIQTGLLTPDQRTALFDQGIDKITDASGEPVTASGPILTALHGDTATYKAGTELILDVGFDATLKAESHLKSLVVKFVGTKSFFDLLDAEAGAHFKIQGTTPEGEDRVFFDTIEIGTVFRETFAGSLHFSFNEKATTEHVQEIIRSISYSYDSILPPSSGVRNIEFTLEDVGRRTGTATSTVRFGEVSVPPTTPSTDDGRTNTGGGIDGTAGNDSIIGRSGNDLLSGLEGNDKLWGGLGNDTMTGGAGKDVFVFATRPNKKTNKDKIADFKPKDDSIWFENKIFTKLGKSGSEKKPAQLKKDFFVLGSKAKDKNDYIVYDNKKGALYYDADGSGSGKAVEIATLSKKLPITYKDFFVI